MNTSTATNLITWPDGQDQPAPHDGCEFYDSNGNSFIWSSDSQSWKINRLITNLHAPSGAALDVGAEVCFQSYWSPSGKKFQILPAYVRPGSEESAQLATTPLAQCQHDMVEYKGLMERFRYCKKCDHKEA